MLFIVRDFAGSSDSIYHFVVDAENKQEAEKLANEYIKNDKRVLFRKFTKMVAIKSFCPAVVNQSNVEELSKEWHK